MLIRWLVNTVFILALPNIVPGVEVKNFFAALIAALVLGVLNALVRPILVLLTLPVTIVTLGLFLLVINALMVWITSAILPTFEIPTFGTALLVALLFWAFGLITNLLTKSAKAST